MEIIIILIQGIADRHRGTGKIRLEFENRRPHTDKKTFPVRFRNAYDSEVDPPVISVSIFHADCVCENTASGTVKDSFNPFFFKELSPALKVLGIDFSRTVF